MKERKKQRQRERERERKEGRKERTKEGRKEGRKEGEERKKRNILSRCVFLGDCASISECERDICVHMCAWIYGFMCLRLSMKELYTYMMCVHAYECG